MPKNSPQRPTLPRILMAGVCVLLAFGAWSETRSWQRNRQAMEAIFTETGVGERDPAALRRTRWERSSHHASLATAWALAYDILIAKPLDTLPEERRAPILENRRAELETVRQLAVEALRQQPNSWQATMLLGAAKYLEWSQSRDPRLFTAAAQWEEPLQEALRQAAGRPEPRRFLATAYIDLWSLLSDDKRAYARELLASVFREDRRAFDHLAPALLGTVEDLREVFDLIPDHGQAWSLVEQAALERQDLRLYNQAHQRRLDGLEVQLAEMIDLAETRVRLGDPVPGRQILNSVFSLLIVDSRFAPFFVRAVDAYPGGLLDNPHGDLAKWLSWALALEGIDDDALPERILGRLLTAVPLRPAEEAHVALIGAQIPHAERLERHSDDLRAPEWAPYLISKSRWLLENERLEEAAASLAAVDPTSRSGARYWRLAQDLAKARGDAPLAERAEHELAQLKGERWRGKAWWRKHQQAHIELFTAREAPGLTLEIAQAPDAGAVVECRWDGQPVSSWAVRQGRHLELPVEITPGRHRLELTVLHGKGLIPGTIRLLPAS